MASRGGGLDDWTKAEKFCFNEWSNPDDDELDEQIVRVSVIPEEEEEEQEEKREEEKATKENGG